MAEQGRTQNTTITTANTSTIITRLPIHLPLLLHYLYHLHHRRQDHLPTVTRPLKDVNDDLGKSQTLTDASPQIQVEDEAMAKVMEDEEKEAMSEEEQKRERAVEQLVIQEKKRVAERERDEDEKYK